MVTFTPAETTPAAAPASGADKKSVKFVPVDNGVGSTTTPGVKDTNPEANPMTFGSVIKNVPKYIGQDMAEGLHTEKQALGDANKGTGLKSGAEAALGAAEFSGAPVTGTVRALVEPFKMVFPQDTTWGKMAYNAVYDAGIMFGPAGVESAAKALKPAIPATKSAIKNLMDGGTQITLGQISGDLAKRLEEGAKSIPILGHFIRQSEGRTFDSWNVATVNRALGPLGKVEAKDAREAVTKAEDLLDKKYDQVRANIPGLTKDADLDADILSLQTRIGELPVGLQDQFDAIVNNRLNNRFGIVGAMDGAAFKKADSELRTVADGLRSSADNAQRELGHAVTDLRMALRGALRRQYPNVAPQLAEVDQAFAKIADVQRAGTASATAAGRFTPGQYLNALKRSDRSARDKDFMKGLRPMQNWAEDAHRVIGNKMPDSGTAERISTDELLKGIGAFASGEFAGSQAGIPGAATAVVAPAAAALPLYTAPGQRFVNAAATAMPDNIMGTAARGSAAAGQAATTAEQLGFK